MAKKSKAQSGTVVQSQAITKTKMGIATAFLGAAALAAGSLAAPSGVCEINDAPAVVVNDTATLELCKNESFEVVFGPKYFPDDVKKAFTVRAYNATNLYFSSSEEAAVPPAFFRGKQGSLILQQTASNDTVEVSIKYLGTTTEKKAKFAVLFQEIVPKDVCFDDDPEDDPWVDGDVLFVSGVTGNEITDGVSDTCKYEVNSTDPDNEEMKTYLVQHGCSATGEIVETSKTSCELSSGFLCQGGTCLPKEPKQPKIGKMTVTINGQVFSTEKSVAKGDVFESGNIAYYTPDISSELFTNTSYGTVTVSLDLLEKTPGAAYAFKILQSGTVNPYDNEYFANFVKYTIGQDNSETFQINAPFFSIYGLAMNSDGTSDVYTKIPWLDDASMMEFAIQPTPTSTASSPTSTP